MEIVVVGSSNTDMVVKSQRIPAAGETVTGGQFLMAPGGKGANQAVAAARLGAHVTLVAKVGDDMFGRQAVAGYARDGIQTDFIFRDPEQATGVALILVDDAGENLISVASGANHRLTATDVERAGERIRTADAVLMQLEIPLDVVRRTTELAAAANVPVILDPAPVPREALAPDLLRRITYLTPNESEASAMTGIMVDDESSAAEAAAILRASGVQNVIITMGSRGALIASADGNCVVAAPRVDAVDSTAAGDAFNGGLAVALGQGRPLQEAVRWANLVAAASVTTLGAQPSLPTAERVRELADGLSQNTAR